MLTGRGRTEAARLRAPGPGALPVLALAAALLAGRGPTPGLGAPAQPATPPFPTLPPTMPFPTLPPNIPTPAPQTPTPTARPAQSPTPTRVATREPTPTPAPSPTVTPTPSFVLTSWAFLPCAMAFGGIEPDLDRDADAREWPSRDAAPSAALDGR